MGIYHYGARFYSPKLGRFLSADTVVPGAGNPQAFNRYSYGLNNPVKYNDPTGHCVLVEDDGLCLRRNKKKNTYHIVHPGRGRFANNTELAIADFILSGDPKSLNRAPSYAALLDGAAMENACQAVGKDCGNHRRARLTILAASIGALSGAYPAAGTGPGSAPNASVPKTVQSDLGDPDCSGCGYIDPYRTIKDLEGGNPHAHAWDKHGPNASDANLQQESLNSTFPQTKFTSGEEMANAVSATLSANMADIQTKANSGKAFNFSYSGGPMASYTGYYQGSPISGQGPTRVVVQFDGKGGWTLHSAYLVP